MNPKKYFKNLLPTPEKVKRSRGFNLLGSLLHDPSIWHINRRSIAGGVAIGFFFGWYPVPFQMLCAGLIAIWLRKNLPLATIATFISNPVTMPPMFYFAYVLGNFILHHVFNVSNDLVHGNVSFDWLFQNMAVIWQPLLLGCFIMSVVTSATGYFFMRFVWRMLVLRRMHQRIARRKKNTHPEE